MTDEISHFMAVKRVSRRERVPRDETPAERRRRALALQRQVERRNPWPRPRGFVFRAPTWQAYEDWRRIQENPRLW